MKTKKVAALLAAGLLSTSAVAFAADSTSSATTKSNKPTTTSSQNQDKSQSTKSTQKSDKSTSQAKPELTDAQKAEREQKSAAKEARASKWAALSASQKNQVYAIEEKIVALEKEKLDTLASLGVIDKATADAQKKQLDERLANWKSSGEYPSGKGAKGSKSDVSKGTRSTDKQAS